MERFTISLDESLARQFDELIADQLMAERGVRHGQLNVITLAAEHEHRRARQGAAHVHYRPLR